MTETIEDLATIVRSKNAGPFRLTFDIFFPEGASYRKVRESEAISKELVAKLYHIPVADVLGIYWLDRLNAIKISIRRPIPAGAFNDTDVYGAQQHTQLLAIQIPE